MPKPAPHGCTGDVMRLGGWLAGLVALLFPSVLEASVDPACDLDADGVVDEYDPALWSEARQQSNMLNFFGMSLSYSPLRAPASLRPARTEARLSLSYVPSLTCLERSVFNGQKTENTNKSPVIPQLRVSVGLPAGFFVGLTGIPPVTMFGVKAGMIGAELGFAHQLASGLQVGIRGTAQGARIEGDLAGPFEGQEAENDIYRASVYALEGMMGQSLAAHPLGATLVPYVGVGYSRVIALMYVGESLPDDFDETDPNQATVPSAGNDAIAQGLYSGLHLQLGLEAERNGVEASVELAVVPLGFRTLISPRLALGYRFF